ncbi:MAG: hypothetical protein ACE5D6_04655, partial [Candidatus Zixiibacteriota bacterium]
IHLLRYVDGRPTTAIFIGKGNAVIDIPSHVERQSLLSITGDSLVNEVFKICFIRIADDFDLKLKERFPFTEKELKWKEFTQIKQAQGEFFFKPVIQHFYDNYFQLLSSVYERSQDGYFWIDFNRYIFNYDPHQPEQVIISYEFLPGDLVDTKAAVFQKKEINIYDDVKMSTINYPTTSISKHGTFEMGGMDGAKLMNAETEMKLVVNVDSLKYISTFLHFNLKIDSIYSNGKPVDYYRRKDFNFVGIILPEYKHKGDTITLTYWYKGKKFDYSLPYVEDPTPAEHSFTFLIPKDYNYLMPGMEEISTYNNKLVQFEVNPGKPYHKFFFQPYATGYDTVQEISDLGISVNFLKSKYFSKKQPCYVSDKQYRTTIMDAFNFMSNKIGNPFGIFELYVYPDNFYTMPGIVEVPQIICHSAGILSELGGFHIFAGYSVARQWFGSQTKPTSNRDYWIGSAAAEYLSMLFIHNSLKGVYFTNLVSRRDSIYTLNEIHEDRPLGVGNRVSKSISSNRGVWLFHMLRFLMYDIATNNEKKFYRFLNELSITCNSKKFSAEDFIHLAEKHYGQSLDWFFKQWLYSFGFPHYEVEYSIAQRGNEYYINATVETKGVDQAFHMPVILRVEDKNENSLFFRENVTGTEYNFELGPFTSKPKKFIFNEFYSVLSKDKVKKK